MNKAGYTAELSRAVGRSSNANKLTFWLKKYRKAIKNEVITDRPTENPI